MTFAKAKGVMPLHQKMGRKKSDFENHHLVPMRERIKDQGYGVEQ
jgi:hypothetical protein